MKRRRNPQEYRWYLFSKDEDGRYGGWHQTNTSKVSVTKPHPDKPGARWRRNKRSERAFGLPDVARMNHDIEMNGARNSLRMNPGIRYPKTTMPPAPRIGQTITHGGKAFKIAAIPSYGTIEISDGMRHYRVTGLWWKRTGSRRNPGDYMAAANTIWAQLGHARPMIGAKNAAGGQDDKGNPYISFKIGANPKKVTHVRITLMPSDTYKMEFMSIRGTKLKMLAEVDGVYGDMMGAMIEQHTALRTSLGNMRSNPRKRRNPDKDAWMHDKKLAAQSIASGLSNWNSAEDPAEGIAIDFKHFGLTLPKTRKLVDAFMDKYSMDMDASLEECTQFVMKYLK